MIKGILIALLGGIFMGLTAPSYASVRSVFSDVPVDPECETEYLKGKEWLEAGVKTRQLGTDYLKEGLRTIGKPQCKIAFALGAHDMLSAMIMHINIEYVLEQRYLETNETTFHPHREQLRSLYAERLQQLSASPRLLDPLEKGSEQYQLVIASIDESYRQMAQREDQLVGIGRFVYTAHRERPLTLYDYLVDEEGRIIYNQEGHPQLAQGSYGRLITRYRHKFIENVASYLRWQPALLFGDDNWLWGKERRELKETTYGNKHLFFLRKLAELHYNLKRLKPYSEAFWSKQQGTYRRDKEFLKDCQKALIYAPLTVAVSMYGGVLGGLAGNIFPKSMNLLKLLRLTGPNTAALIAATPVAAFAGAGAVQAALSLGQGEINVYQALDQIFATTMKSFPLAAILPPATIAVTALGGALSFSLADLGVKIPMAMRAIGQHGLTGLPRVLGAKWAQAWADREVLKAFSVDCATLLLFEIAVPQLVYHGADRPLNWNEAGELQIKRDTLLFVPSWFGSGIMFLPIVLIKNHIIRYVFARGAYSLTAASMNLLFPEEIDERHLFHDLEYGATGGTVMGEVDRMIRYGEFAKRFRGVQGNALFFLLSAGMRLVRTESRLYSLERMDQHPEGSAGLVADLRNWMQDELNIDASELPDEELLRAYQRALDLSPEEFLALVELDLERPGEAPTPSDTEQGQDAIAKR